MTINLAQIKAFRIEEYGYKHPENPPKFHLKAYYSFEEIEQTVILGSFENIDQATSCMFAILRGDYDLHIPPLSFYPEGYDADAEADAEADDGEEDF